MVSDQNSKTVGAAIDGIIESLAGLDQKSQLTAIKAAWEHLGLTTSGQLQPAAPWPTTTAEAALPQQATGHASTDIRTLKDTKEPSTVNEMACIVAYYLESLAPPGERKDRISAADINRYFRQAGYPLPKAQKQVLLNAKRAGYFDSLGGGEFRLNPVGHNLVVHSLPRTSEAASARKTRKPRRTVKKKPRRVPKARKAARKNG